MKENTDRPTRRLLTEAELLDNMVWHALAGPHRHLAHASGPARVYDRDVALFGAVESSHASNWDHLERLAEPGTPVAFVGPLAECLPTRWKRLTELRLFQMVLRSVASLADPDPAVAIEPLSPTNVTQMLSLVDLTRPGPFQKRTIEMGDYFGIFDGEDLIAMAGERLRAPGYTEISAVATHPMARGRGLAAQLTSHVARSIASGGDHPMLHVAETNESARRLYERLGFQVRSRLSFIVAESPFGRIRPLGTLRPDEQSGSIITSTTSSASR